MELFRTESGYTALHLVVKKSGGEDVTREEAKKVLAEILVKKLGVEAAKKLTEKGKELQLEIRCKNGRVNFWMTEAFARQLKMPPTYDVKYFVEGKTYVTSVMDARDIKIAPPLIEVVESPKAIEAKPPVPETQKVEDQHDDPTKPIIEVLGYISDGFAAIRFTQKCGFDLHATKPVDLKFGHDGSVRKNDEAATESTGQVENGQVICLRLHNEKDASAKVQITITEPSERFGESEKFVLRWRG